METHTPTMKLRWKHRAAMAPILQQWWVEDRHYDVHWTTPISGEWRDVPSVETTKDTE